MQYKTLGKTKLHVSRIGLGGIPVQRVDAEKTHKLLEYLCEQGVNYIDTARGYTVSEEYLGEALVGMRDKFIIATKSMSRSYEDMARDIDISLKNLQTDYIDIYQLHNIKTDADFKLAFSDKGAVAAIKDAIADGKVG
ncbi:MAG: aldo/keto reductase, partial [Oscillospiraceae bacterium]